MNTHIRDEYFQTDAHVAIFCTVHSLLSAVMNCSAVAAEEHRMTPSGAVPETTLSGESMRHERQLGVWDQSFSRAGIGSRRVCATV